MPVSLVQRGPFSYDEYTNISSSDASTRTFTLDKAKFDSTIGEVLEVFVDGVKLVGDGTFVTGGSNPATGASAHEFSVNSAKTQLTIVSDSDLASATDSAVATVSAGNDILIRRVSNRTAKKVDFAPGSVIREADLDNANTQVFHVAQEAIDTALQGMVLDTDSKWNAESGGVNRTIKNAATPTSSDPSHYVATKGYVDVSTDVPTVAGQISPTNNIATIAGQITPDNNIATVAGKATEIQTVADLEDGTTATNAVSTVASKASEIQTVADLEDGTTATGAISAVAGKSSEIEKLGTSAMATATTGHLARIGTDQHTNSTSGTLTRLGTDQHANSTSGTLTRLGTDQHTNSTTGTLTRLAGTDDTHTNTSTGTLARLAGTDDTHTNTSTGTLKILGTSANVTAMSELGTSANVTNMANLSATGVIDDLATLGSGKDGKSVGTVGYDSGTKTNIEQINTVVTSIADINNYADTYFGTDSTSDGPTGSFTAGDLYFSTYLSENKLKVYNGSAWQNATSAVEGVATVTEWNSSTSTAVNGTNKWFAFTHDVGIEIVWLNGVRLIQGTDYLSVNAGDSSDNMVSGTASHLYFATPPVSGDVLSAMAFGTVELQIAVPKSGGTFTGAISGTDLTLSGDLTVNGTTTTLDTAVQNVDKLEVGASSTDYGAKINQSSTGNILQLQDNGTDVMVVKDGGNVGIGTNAPGEALHIKTTADADYGIKVENDDTQAFCKVQSSGNALYGGNAGVNIVSGGSFATAMHIDSSGNVGIGTNSPTSDGGTTLEIYNASTPTLRLNDGGDYKALVQLRGNDTEIRGSSGNMEFYTGNADGASSTERMRIDSSGNVGIGSTTPASFITRSGTGRGLVIYNPDGGDTGGGANEACSAELVLAAAATNTQCVISYNDDVDSSPNGSILYDLNADDMYFKTGGSNTTRMIISSAGNVRFNNYSAGTLSTDSSGNITASDQRLKTITRRLESGLDLVERLSPTFFKWKEETGLDRKVVQEKTDDQEEITEYRGTEHLGFIAQEVQAIIPEASHSPDNPERMMNYEDRGIIALLVKSVQELSAKVEALENA